MTRSCIEALRFHLVRGFARLAVHVFYRRVEILGLGHLPRTGPVLLCANHSNALIDAVIIQAAIPRPVRPLARSGLFHDPKLKLPLALQGAVPVFRKGDPGVDPARNESMFARCFDILASNGVLLIFPEGQSHSEPSLRPLKTGAARIALGAGQAGNPLPTVLPVGLTFTRKGSFRGGLLVQIGTPIALPQRSDDVHPGQVRRTTRLIEQGLRSVTINIDSWQELDLLRRAQRFLALRRGRRQNRDSLGRHYHTVRRLDRLRQRIRRQAPERLDELRQRLIAFEKLCTRLGVRDYQVTLEYTPAVVARFLLRTLFDALVLLPIACWGVLNSVLPYWSAHHLAERMAATPDQRDSARLAAGILLFGLFWGLQTLAVWRIGGNLAAAGYALSLPLSGWCALVLYGERRHVRENLAAFLLFLRQRHLKPQLQQQRADLETRLLAAVRSARPDSTPVERHHPADRWR